MKLSASLLVLACMSAATFAAAPSTPSPATATATPPASTAATPKPAKPADAKKPKKVSIKMSDGMQFDPPRFEAKQGEEVEVELENADSAHQPHNFLVLMPGKRDEIVKQSLELGEKGPAQDFIPVNPAIIVHSALLGPDGTSKIHFTMPAEKGIYPYVCSMPGHGMLMYGAIYCGVKMPALQKDHNIPPQAMQAAMPGSGRRPYIQRMFMPDSGPASIAVALPGNLNYCWDAGECRLRYVWRGAFIDASAQWRGNGRDLPSVPTPPWWSAEKGKLALQIGAAAGTRPIKFLGYKIDAGIPEFHYRLGDTEVFEKITASPKDAGVAVHFRIPKTTEPVQLSMTTAAPKPASKATESNSAPQPPPPSAQITSVINGATADLSNHPVTLTPAQAADFTVTIIDTSKPASPH